MAARPFAQTPPRRRPRLTPLRWVEVDVAALRHNAAFVRRRAGGAPFTAVVKADGYGHGAVTAARAALAAGADGLAVTYLEEALPLRRAGLRAPVLVMGPVPPADAGLAARENLTVMVDNVPLVRALGRHGNARRPRPVHIEVERGLHRWGVALEALRDFLRAVDRVAGVRVEGVFAHPGYVPGKNRGPVERRLKDFFSTVRPLLKDRPGVRCPVANSAVLLDFPEYREGGVRVGNLLYGLNPTADPWPLKTPWRALARIVRLQRVRRGEEIGYGGEHRAARDALVATLPVGYAHGVGLSFGPPPRAFWGVLRGRRCPVLGRVGMGHTLVDVSAVPRPRVGEAVGVPLRRTASAGWTRVEV